LLAAYQERDGLGWDDPKLQAIDLQYHDVRRERGLYYRLDSSARWASDDRRGRRRGDGTAGGHRAYFRGRCISRYPDAIAAASWDSLIGHGADALQRIPMREPPGEPRHVEDLLLRSRTRLRW
jgi:proteasome accessory factor A